MFASTTVWSVAHSAILDFVDRLQRFGFPPRCYPSYALSVFSAVSNADASTMTYDAFGKLLDYAGAAQDHDYRFTGKPSDSTGLSYYGARFYDPELGRFINQDPGRDGLNWYLYCKNNPLGYVDPNSEFAIPITEHH